MACHLEARQQGKCNSLAIFVYNRQGKNGEYHIVFELLCNTDGCPFSVEMFCGNITNPSTSMRRSLGSSNNWVLTMWRWWATGSMKDDFARVGTTKHQSFL